MKVILLYDSAYELPFYMHRGRETFYDEGGWQRRWATKTEAVAWLQEAHGVTPVDHTEIEGDMPPALPSEEDDGMGAFQEKLM